MSISTGSRRRPSRRSCCIPWSVRSTDLSPPGSCPQAFRDEMRLPWSVRQQRNFDRSMRVAALVNRLSPKILRMFPYNFYLWDLRRRIAKGIPLV